MNERIQQLAEQCRIETYGVNGELLTFGFDEEKFAELIVEAVLDQVAERAYYTGDRDWSDEIDRPWIQLEFGYGKLAEMKNERSN